ncbi:helix-turn-helix transcriptional regulator [Clostridium perfringens]|uniref:Helix-turn-helix domain-containing protein n=1 Tax=Clostridium perfringens TaxID=1502 RepID=A0AAW9IR73_CLOPF|nr:helix-turn-helix transcriptional regulator [Clostridium perfringens]MBI6079093.1 helix-turn-helix transcriptional regulator [Clostridium perfringens]MBI6084941.1 helix-turn-helix transcriptional regulator [Clostridium perfringens]MBI6098681.1 helix-turn-helix transcriptional regulator [Clostridium perfringens]MDK0548199.1 helix-turn-helix transcriptional regulator [Clostridium perfringens]MDK0574858.1 helix-turn-helix transcriptional regulator [Clostridium perfringens]
MEIKLARIKKNLTQKELAEKLGVTPQYLRLIELDKIDIKKSLMIKLSMILEISIQDLFFKED